MKTHNRQGFSSRRETEPFSSDHQKTLDEAPWEIGNTLQKRQSDIESWILAQWKKIRVNSMSPPRTPFYTSVDLRNAGFKLVPVDTNLFPSGFNNLCPSCLPGCACAASTAIRRTMPTAQRLLLIPENHTRNLNYLESVASLADILINAGFEVRIGSLLPNLQDPITVDLPSRKSIRLEPITRRGYDITVADFSPCVILLNNDLAGGRPAILEECKPVVIPPLDLGWRNRLKSDHFIQYGQVATEFADHLGFDPWLINPLFQNCGEIDFMRREGEKCLAKNVDELLDQIRRKYREYGINKQPFVFIKADAGTYGMGVMPVYKAEDIYTLNRRQRTRMSSAKGGRSVTKVILQEGVHSCETWGDASPATAEPVVYLIDRTVVGGFYRVHAERGETENLNARGMRFESVPFFAPACRIPNTTVPTETQSNRFYAYGVVARLALLAAAREMLEVGTKT